MPSSLEHFFWLLFCTLKRFNFFCPASLLLPVLLLIWYYWGSNAIAAWKDAADPVNIASNAKNVMGLKGCQGFQKDAPRGYDLIKFTTFTTSSSTTFKADGKDFAAMASWWIKQWLHCMLGSTLCILATKPDMEGDTKPYLNETFLHKTFLYNVFSVPGHVTDSATDYISGQLNFKISLKLSPSLYRLALTKFQV